MASNEGITVFRQLLAIVSKWYDHHEYISMLKVLYRDCVKDFGELSKASGTMKLMNLLIASGKLHSRDLSVLYDTIKATDTFGLINKIKSKISCPNIRGEKISKFTHHRQKVMKLGMALRDEDVVKISQLYPIEKGYEDSWSLIMDLEYRTIIQKGKMKAFIDKMEENKLVQAVKALTEDISVASSNTVVGFGKEEDSNGSLNSVEECGEGILHKSSFTYTAHQSSAMNTALSDKELQELKTIVSQWYDSNESVPLLKVLFRDKIYIHKLSPETHTMDLLNMLFVRGHLSSQNLGLLCDTISITKQFGLLSKIKQKLPSFPDVEEGTISKRFTSHRQRLMKFGMVLTPDNVTQIDQLYNTPHKNYKDGWSMINDLEDRQKISEENMKEFTDSLKILKLSLALYKLTEA